MPKIDPRKKASKAIQVVKKLYDYVDKKRKVFTAEHQNFNIDRYNLKHGTNIKHMKSANDRRLEAENKKLKKHYEGK